METKNLGNYQYLGYIMLLYFKTTLQHRRWIKIFFKYESTLKIHVYILPEVRRRSKAFSPTVDRFILAL